MEGARDPFDPHRPWTWQGRPFELESIEWQQAAPEAGQVEIKGVAQHEGQLVPVSVRVPPDHPFLRGMAEGDSYTREDRIAITVDEQMQISDHLCTPTYSQEINRALSVMVTRMQAEAVQQFTANLMVNLESLRPALTKAVQERLSLYFGECARAERRPLTWDSASHAVGAALECLREELTP
jgi:hypothetical protein